MSSRFFIDCIGADSDPHALQRPKAEYGSPVTARCNITDSNAARKKHLRFIASRIV